MRLVYELNGWTVIINMLTRGGSDRIQQCMKRFLAPSTESAVLHKRAIVTQLVLECSAQKELGHCGT